MRIFRISTLTAVTCAALSGALLFSTAQKVQQADGDMRRAQSRVAQEEQTIRVLRAEWDYLNRPDRLEGLVRNNLDLEQARPESVRNDTSELPTPYVPIVPARKPAYTSPVVKAMPAVMQAGPDATSSQALSRPAAPQPPVMPADTPQKDFNKLLNELSPAGGGE